MLKFILTGASWHNLFVVLTNEKLFFQMLFQIRSFKSEIFKEKFELDMIIFVFFQNLLEVI